MLTISKVLDGQAFQFGENVMGWFEQCPNPNCGVQFFPSTQVRLHLKGCSKKAPLVIHFGLGVVKTLREQGSQKGFPLTYAKVREHFPELKDL